MANPKKRVPENVPGDFFVDSTCIDCDACRQIAPAVFGEAADTSYVKTQPAGLADRRQVRGQLQGPAAVHHHGKLGPQPAGVALLAADQESPGVAPLALQGSIRRVPPQRDAIRPQVQVVQAAVEGADDRLLGADVSQAVTRHATLQASQPVLVGGRVRVRAVGVEEDV